MTDFTKFAVEDWMYFLEHRHEQEIELGLSRIMPVANRLDLLDFGTTKEITVSGTNGKGSTVSALESIYRAADYNVGTYTSPHLFTFNERIRVNSIPIPDEILCEAFQIVEKARGDIILKYFEAITLAALWYFKKCNLDLIILEVGMGGRRDATNIIDSNLAIITTVDLDHQKFLGDTKERIGYEKAGILRESKPFIYADDTPPNSVVEEGQLLNAPMHCLDKTYSFHTDEEGFHLTYGQTETIDLPIPQLNLKAAAAAIIASIELNPLIPVTHEERITAMQSVSIYGRQQIITHQGKTTIFDVAHNPQAVQLLVERIKQYQCSGRVHAVFSALKDKDVYGLIRPLSTLVNFWYPAKLEGNRATSEEELMSILKSALNITPRCFDSPCEAYEEAFKRAEPADLLIVYGSFMTVGAVLAAQNESMKSEKAI